MGRHQNGHITPTVFVLRSANLGSKFLSPQTLFRKKAGACVVKCPEEAPHAAVVTKGVRGGVQPLLISGFSGTSTGICKTVQLCYKFWVFRTGALLQPINVMVNFRDALEKGKLPFGLSFQPGRSPTFPTAPATPLPDPSNAFLTAPYTPLLPHVQRVQASARGNGMGRFLQSVRWIARPTRTGVAILPSTFLSR